MNTYTKVSESEFEVSKVAEVVAPVVTKYSLDFLKKQELDILKSMNDFIAQREKELLEVRGLISEAGKLGLKTREELQAEKVIEEEAKLETMQEIIK